MTMTKSKHIFDIISSEASLQEVDCGWMKFAIEIVPSLKSDEDKCWGCVDFESFTLRLEKKMKDAPARETLLHEICHIFIDTCGLGNSTEGSPEKFEVSNEQLTVIMTRCLLMFSRLNPELAKELLCPN